MGLLQDIGGFLKRDLINPAESLVGIHNQPQQPQAPRPQQIQQQTPGGPIAPKAPQLILKSGLQPQQFDQNQNKINFAQPPQFNLQGNSLTKNPLTGSPSKPGPNSTMKIASATPPVKNGFNKIKVNALPGSFVQRQAQGTLPGHAPQTGFDKTVSNFFKPIGALGSGLVKGTGKILGTGVEDVRALTAKATGNEPAFQSAMKRGSQDIQTAEQAVQSVPRAGVQIYKSVFSPSSQLQPKGVGAFILGKQPVQSFQQIYKQNPGASGAGQVAAAGIGDVLSLAPVVAKGLSLAKGETPSPAEPNEPIKIASTPVEGGVKLGQGSGQPTPEPTPVTSKDVGNFLKQTTQKPEMVDTGDFTKDLETNANLTRGNYDANRLLVRSLIDNAQKAYEEDPTDFEAAYHYTEDPTIQLTPDQQAIYDNYVKPINDMATQGVNELKGSEFENAGHIPRIALDRTTKAESYLTGQSKNPVESVLRKTSNVTLKRNMKAIEDENGQRVVVSIKSPKDKTGKVIGQKQVTAIQNGNDLDSLGAYKDANGSQVVKNGDRFTDKNGKTWTVKDATTKEIEANTNVRYIKNPVVTTSLAHTNVRNAINAKQFLDWMKTRPDAETHMIKIGTTSDIPENWESINSPFFKGYMFDPKTAKVLNNLFGREQLSENIAGKAWQGLNSIATQFIVINPAIHGANLAELADAEVSNTGLGAHPEFAANVGRMLDPTTRGDMIQDYLRAGGHIPNYGKEIDTIFTKTADKLGVPHFTKANATAMSSIDATFRSAAFKTDVDRGVDPAEAVRQIDTFLGKKEMIGPVARNTTLFYHYFLRTLPRVLKAQITHPVKNFGSIVTTAAWYFGIQYGLNKAWQQFTGNKNAHLKLPGETGFIHDITQIPAGIKQIGEGQIPSVVSSHAAPGISILWDQLTGKQSYSGAPVKTTGQRLTNVEQHLISPSQNVSKISSGRSTIPEQLLNEFGFYTPHAKGAPAVPQGPLRIVNTKGAKPVLTLNAKGQKDVTGYSQETDYYNGLDKYITNGGLDTSDQNAANAFIQRTRDANGQTVMNMPGQTAANWAQLAQNPGALKAVQNFEKSQGNHDPEWDLSPQQMKVWATYHSLAPGDPERDVLIQKNSWITDKTTQEQDWINKQTFSGNVVYPPGYVQYPKIPQNVQDMMTQVSNLSAIPAENRTTDQENQLKNLENNPDLQNAYQALDNYTNAERKSMGLTPINYMPNVPANVSNWSNAYEAASSAERKVMKAQDPNMYAAMNQAYENSDLSTLEKQASIAYLSGKPSDSLLSAIYNLGTYDVNKVKNPNGTTTYSLTNFGGGIPLMNSGEPVLNAVNGYAPASSSASSYSKSKKSKTPYFPKAHGKLPKKPHSHKLKKTYLKYSSKTTGKGGAVKVGKAQKINFASTKGIPVNRAKAPSSNAIKYAG